LKIKKLFFISARGSYYKPIVDTWVIFDNSGDIPLTIEEKS